MGCLSVPPRQKGRKRTREFEKPLSGLNVEELLGREKRVKLSAENAIPEFKQALNTTDSVEDIKNIANQLSTIIQDYIRHSMGDSGYQRAVEAIRVMKEEMLELEEPGVFNDFMRVLKKKIFAEELGGDRKEMWYKIRVTRLGLIDKRATDLSDVTEEEAKKVGALFYLCGLYCPNLFFSSCPRQSRDVHRWARFLHSRLRMVKEDQANTPGELVARNILEELYSVWDLCNIIEKAGEKANKTSRQGMGATSSSKAGVV